MKKTENTKCCLTFRCSCKCFNNDWLKSVFGSLSNGTSAWNTLYISVSIFCPYKNVAKQCEKTAEINKEILKDLSITYFRYFHSLSSIDSFPCCYSFFDMRFNIVSGSVLYAMIRPNCKHEFSFFFQFLSVIDAVLLLLRLHNNKIQ